MSGEAFEREIATAQVDALRSYADALEVSLNATPASATRGMRPGLLVAIELARQGAAAIAEKYGVSEVGVRR